MTNKKSAARKSNADAVRKSKEAKPSALEIFQSAMREGDAKALVIDLVKRFGAKPARDHYVAGFYVARLRREGAAMYPANEPDVIAHKRAISQVGIGCKFELTTAQAKAKQAALTSFSRITADLGVRADKRGAKRGARGPNKATNAPAAGNAPVSPIVPAPVPAPVTFASVIDGCLAMVRNLEAMGKKHAGMQGFSGIAATIAKHTLPIEKALLAVKG